MSNILIRLFEIATEKLPFYTTDALEAAEAALEARLGEAGLPLLRTYEDARYERDLREEKQLFFIALALGIELGRLTPSADAFHMP